MTRRNSLIDLRNESGAVVDGHFADIEIDIEYA